MPIWVYPPNSFKFIVCPAEAEITGKPEISLTENISPEDRLLSIENNCPEFPSHDRELSVWTVSVIGALDVAPINAIEGFVVMPVNPKAAFTKDNCPETPKPPATNNDPVDGLVEAIVENILVAPPIFKAPWIPVPADTINDPVNVEVDAREDVTANPDTLKISVNGLYTKLLSVDTAAPEAVPVEGVNKTLWIELDVADTTLMLVDVVAVPDVIPYPDCKEYVEVVAKPDVKP